MHYYVVTHPEPDVGCACTSRQCGMLRLGLKAVTVGLGIR